MNQRSDNYLARALHEAKLAELIDRYTKNGFTVQRDVRLNSREFDLVVKSNTNDQTIAFEIKLLPLHGKDKNAIESLREAASELGYEFRLVTIAQPIRPSIQIEWLDGAVLDYLVDTPITDIEELATHVQYEAVELTVDALHVTGDHATANVRGSIDVELQYGSNSDLANDNGMTTSYSVPFEGRLDVDLSSQTVDTAELRVDVSEWIDVGEV